ncbi:hypothetical protein [Hymenobacter arizonensis]|uniref:hypothetical protein n=1 Tax=Hymenobacter arizonensis TaxID=1227077 RepID=UPI0015A63A29|nr:hypothetical protein [Hymenobacter arizonensis]
MNHSVVGRSTWVAALLWLLMSHAGYAQLRRTSPANPAVICWQEGLKLRWSDFQAPQNLLPDAGVGAHTGTSIDVRGEVDALGRPAYVVACYFSKKESWVRDSSAEGNHILLAHEQVHFDLAELFARKIRQRIAQCRRRGDEVWGPELQAEIEGLLREWSGVNAVFDQEAAVEQRLAAFDEEIRAFTPTLQRWQSRVRRELTALGLYGSSDSTCGQKS